MSDLKAFRVLLSSARSYRWRLLGGGLAIVLQAAFQVGAALGLGRLVQEGLLPGISSQVLFWAGVIVLSQGLSLFFGYVGKRTVVFVATSVVKDIRVRLNERLAVISLPFYDRERSGEMLTRLTSDVDGLENFFTDMFVRLSSTLLSFVCVLGFALLVHPSTGLLILLGSLVPFAIALLSRVPLRRRNGSFAAANGQANAKLSEHLDGFPMLVNDGLEAWSEKELDQTVEHFEKTAGGLVRLSSWTGPAIQVSCYLPVLFLFGFAGSSVIAGGLGLGLFVAYLRIAMQLIQPIQNLAFEIQNLQSVLTSAHRVAGVLSAKSEDELFGGNGSLQSDRLQGDIEFKNVGVRYGDRVALKDVSFRIRPGEHVGLVGVSGSGKSTSVNVLMRLYPYQEGVVELDGRPIDEFERSALRRRIGYVSQDESLFEGSLWENLTLGEVFSESDVEEACRATGFDEVMRVRGLSFGSPILSQGRNLSSGEKQLLAVTRVFLSDPDLLILDEATSRVDAAFEAQIQKGLNALMAEKTCLVIAHRESALSGCDRVVTLAGGQVSG